MSPKNATSLNEQPLAPSTDRCLAILEVLSRHPEGLTLSEFHRQLGVSKNMVFRILTDMAARGYVYRDAEKTFYLGAKLLELAAPRVHGRNLVDEAAPVVRALRDECGESVGLLVPNGSEAVLIYFQPARHPMRMIFDLGYRLALYCNAPGKVFLAFGDEKERQRRMKLQSFQKQTAQTITSRARLETELEQARQVGYTTDRGEDIEGAHCVAAPVFDRERQLVAALVIAGPSQRMTARAMTGLGQKAVAAAAALNARLAI
jgi:DNA-binding IclR family transcriptional regulator